jgi:hypothetical protein
MPSVPVNRNSLPATMTLLLPTLDISRMTDGNTSSSGALDYAAHPNGADGKHILFDFKGTLI